MDDRANGILEMLIDRERMEVSELAKEMGVSQVTVRKYLNELESRGLITREHGYAAIKSTDNVEGRLARHYEQKLRIARRAVACVPDGATVIVENGSCCALLAVELARTKKDLTIITNSAFVARYVGEAGNCQIILIGGIYQHSAQVLVGPMVPLCLTGIQVDVMFIGADGFDPDTGFANRDQMRAQAVRDMAMHAMRIVILTESEKFGHSSTVSLNLPQKNTMVITDDNIPDEASKQLMEHGIELETV